MIIGDRQTAAKTRRERAEDGFITSFQEMLAVMRRIHDRGGDPNIKAIIERAQAARGRH